MTDSQNTKLIPLTQGKFAIVDEADYEWLMQWKWCYHHGGYAVRTQHIEYTNGKQKQKTIMMHRVIIDAADNCSVDHIDTNRLHNVRNNLRCATPMQNHRNRRKTRGTSQYKGVWRNEKSKNWTAKITVNKKQIYLGSFNSEIDAAKAYNIAALKYFGVFARINAI